jgi:alpha-galactosidase
MKSMVLAFAAAVLSANAQIVSPDTNLTEREQQIVTAAVEPLTPRFHGARIVGVRPGTPFVYSLAATGKQPLKFAVAEMPPDLQFDLQTGVFSGMISSPGNYDIRVRAENTVGRVESEFRIVCGDQLALLPPMGWNSYDAFGDSVVESEVLTNAQWMRDHLQSLGWDTVVVDFRWYDRLADGVRVQNPEGVTIDAFGRCIPPTNRFPSAANGAGFGPLADKIHAMGLKFGIHIMRGIPRRAVEQNLPIDGSKLTAAQAALPEGNTNRTCIWNHDMFGVDAATDAGKDWYASIAKQYADWGVDYIKCDDIANMQRGDYYAAREIEALSAGLRNSGRSIVLSLSPGAAPLNCGPHLKQFANLWRISGDFWDNWRSLNRNFDLFSSWLPDAAPGHWPDGDMIPLGHICQRNCDVHPDRWTRFTRDEQLTLMSLWALAPSPLMLGMNLPDNDAWTTALLTNPEVLGVNQDVLAKSARRMSGPPQVAETWMKELTGGAYAVGFFNRTDQSITVKYPWREAGFLAAPAVRDLWTRKDLGNQEVFMAEIPPHGCSLVSVK